MPTEIVLDFETANAAVDLGDVGSTAYAKHWATEVLCLGWDVNDRPGLWHPGLDVAELHRLANQPDLVWIAHNAGFEKDIWRHVLVPWFGLPDIPNHRWHDTMATALLRGLPAKLEKLLLALGLPGKDMQGSRFTIALSKHDKRGMLDRRPETLERVYQYVAKDVADEKAVHRLLGFLPPAERQVWLVDQEINERGLRFDIDMIRGAMRIYDQVAPQLVKEFRALTGLSPTQTTKFRTWLDDRGVFLKDLRKETIAALIGDIDDSDDHPGMLVLHPGGGSGALPEDACRALTIRALVGSSSVTKYWRMAECADPASHRIARLLQYHGAGTGRWAGRLSNPHNMPRGVVRRPDGRSPDHHTLAAAIASGEVPRLADLGLLIDGTETPAHAIHILASALRNTVVARPGRVLAVGDWKNIEARLVLAIAGQRDKIALMAAGLDAYLDMAAVIYHCEVTKADVEKRQVGKNTVLGCGFQMSWKTFRERYCHKETPKFAWDVIKSYRENWAPRVPHLWSGLGDAALSAVQQPGRVCGFAGLEFRVEGGWLVGHCPDGSCLYYYRPTLDTQLIRWTDVLDDGTIIARQAQHRSPAWRYQVPTGKVKAERVGMSGSWVFGYGGLMTENYVQHMARQLLCGALLRARKEGLTVVLHNQDELVLECEEREAPLLKEVMEYADQPWVREIAKDPDGNQIKLIDTDCWSDTRYRK